MPELEGARVRLTPPHSQRPIFVQVLNDTGMSILIHVVEHFSYHVGQMAYIVKARLDKPTNFYGGINLNNEWRLSRDELLEWRVTNLSVMLCFFRNSSLVTRYPSFKAFVFSSIVPALKLY